ncbi:mucin-2-like [Cloeon dipterum]|uniref:mucin-2-like n=1 Tax=Cloeon dipterum TaxID=197152 RepID=UPI0032202BD5
MAHTKIAVGLLLACAICAHAFPADNVPTSRPSFGAGSSSFEPVKPLGGSSGPGSSAGVFIPQGNPNFLTGTTAGRFIRDDQEAAARSPLSGTTVLPSSTRNTREVTNSPVKPLAVASTLPPRRDNRDVTSPRPVVLPGSLASSSVSTSAPKNKREEATTAKLPIVSSTVAHRELREATTAKVIATGSPSLGAKPLVPSTAAPKNKRESSTTIVAPIQPLYNGPSTTEAKPFLSISHKNKRQAPLSLDSGSGEEADDDNGNRQLFQQRPTLIPRPSNRPNLFRRTTTTTPSSDSTTTRATRTTTEASKFKRDTSSTTSKSLPDVYSSSSVRPIVKRQDDDDDSNRQLLNRPTVFQRPLRRTTPATNKATEGTKATTTRFRRDVFGTTESFRPYTVESFSGSESLPGQSTYFTGTNVNGQRPDGQQFAGSSIASTSFGTIPHQAQYNKRQADDDDSSSGENSQEQ